VTTLGREADCNAAAQGENRRRAVCWVAGREEKKEEIRVREKSRVRVFRK